MRNAEAMRDLSSSKAHEPSPPERGASPGGDASPAPATLRVAAETLAAGAPQSLQLKAARLADLLLAGTHDRRHAGRGENFWQYRNATSGDPMHWIDWRQSARSDALYIRQTEWETVRTAWIWCDDSASMRYRSRGSPESKQARAALLTMAIAILLDRAGERFALLGAHELKRPGAGRRQLHTLAQALGAARGGCLADYGVPPLHDLRKGAVALLMSDFLGPVAPIAAAIARYAQSASCGVLVMILDEAEETFPFSGRLRLRSMGGTTEYEADRAESLRDAYLRNLAARKAELQSLAARRGWHFMLHHTRHRASGALAHLHRLMSTP